MTREASLRSDLVKAQLDRARLRADLPNEGAFIESLQVVSTVERLTPATAIPAVLERIQDLFARTTQFNATGCRFSALDLQQIVADPEGIVLTLRMADRLADHGLVGAAVIAGGEIRNFVLSCRVIGLGGERGLLAEIARVVPHPVGRIVETERNIPVRHLYRDNGYTNQGEGRWTLSLQAPRAA
jgi:FkbH-like protein